MDQKNPRSRRILALLLCAAMLLTNIPLSAVAETIGKDLATASTTVTAADVQREAPRQFSWTVQNVNYYEKGDVIVLDEFWAATIKDSPSSFNEGVSASWAPFVNGEYQEYTAFIIEYLGSGQAEGNEYFVDAVIDGAVNSDEKITVVQSHTSYGFVLLIPTNRLTPENTPRRGDLVNPNYWHKAHNKGSKDINGVLDFTDNPVSSVHYVDSSEIADVNATVKLFNYGENINDVNNGFNFWAGFWGYGGDVETEDGEGAENYAGGKGKHQYPDMADTLGADGYPVLSDGTSLAYLFNGSSAAKQSATMTGGGGLFQKDDEGYYYYDSLHNAAYYDSGRNSFVLYDDLVVRPWYGAGGGSDYRQEGTTWVPVEPGGAVEFYGNFLPFNQVTTGNITVDGSLSHNITADGSYPQGSLESVGLNSTAAAKVLTGTKGITAEERNAIGADVTTARLEENTDMWFGMTVDFEFFMPEDGKVDGKPMTFDFHGDDDVLVYIGVWNENTASYDYKLVLDIGGVHGARSGKINFATGAVSYESCYPTDGAEVNTDLNTIFNLGEGQTIFHNYTKLNLKFFYLERGGNVSYCRLRFNIPTLPDKSLTVTKELSAEVAAADTAQQIIEESYNYQFRVVHADNADASYFKAGTKYNVLQNGIVVDTRTLSASGIFELKSGQSAQFEDVIANSNGGETYLVQELIPTAVVGQYDAVYYSIGGAGGTEVSGTVSGDQTVYPTGSMQADQTQTVIFRNDLNLDKLSSMTITKVLTDEAKEVMSGHIFRIEVSLDGTLLPVGTVYTVNDVTKTVQEAGVIVLEDGHTATIHGVLSGAEYLIRERTAAGGFAPTFTGTVSEGGTIAFADDRAYGTIPQDGLVAVTVTNDVVDTDLAVDKTVEATDDPDKFTLTLEAFANGNTTNITSTKPADIVLVVDQSASMYTPAGMPVDRLYADKDHADNVPIPESAKVSDFVA